MLAAVARPPSPANPTSPTPANVVKVPFGSIRKMKLSVGSQQSETYRLPAASNASPIGSTSRAWRAAMGGATTAVGPAAAVATGLETGVVGPAEPQPTSNRMATTLTAFDRLTERTR